MELFLTYTALRNASINVKVGVLPNRMQKENCSNLVIFKCVQKMELEDRNIF